VAYGDVPSERAAFEQRIVGRALAEPEFRARLLANPREAMSEELGFAVPEGLEIDVVEERPGRLAIVLPIDLSGIGFDGVWAMTGVRPAKPTPARKHG
jgi:hypothetical protein